MPISVSVSSIEWVRHVVLTGVVSDADLLHGYNMIARCLLDPSMDVVVDTAGLERAALTAQGVARLAALRAGDARGSGFTPPRIVIVAPSPSVFSMAQRCQSDAEVEAHCSRFMVCQTMEQARSLLGLTQAEEPLSLGAHA